MPAAQPSVSPAANGAPRKAIVSIIKGGLGNQLFTYAAGRAMALRLDRDYYIDCRRGYTHDGYGRSFRLDRFPISARTMPEEWRVAPTLKHLKHKATRAWNKLLPTASRSYIAQRQELPPSQLTALSPKPDRVLLSGYWQDESYFSDFSPTIAAELAPPPPKDEQNLERGRRFASTNSVFVHVRRVRFPTLLPLAYYQQAIEEFRHEMRQPEFVVFSDDPGWSRSHLDFGGASVEWVEDNPDDELVDFWLMTRCRHAITANSSFSWWAAWLGAGRNGGIVRAPWPSPIAPAAGWRRIHTHAEPPTRP